MDVLFDVRNLWLLLPLGAMAVVVFFAVRDLSKGD